MPNVCNDNVNDSQNVLRYYPVDHLLRNLEEDTKIELCDCQGHSSTYIFFSVCVFLLSIFEFIFGIIQAIYVTRYITQYDKCGRLYEWTLCWCVFNIVIPIICCFGLSKYDNDCDNLYQYNINYKDYNRNKYRIELDSGKQLIIIITTGFVTISSTVVLSNIGTTCVQYWTESGSEFIMFMKIQLGIMIVMSIIILNQVFCGVFSCDDKWQRRDRSHREGYIEYKRKQRDEFRKKQDIDINEECIKYLSERTYAGRRAKEKEKINTEMKTFNGHAHGLASSYPDAHHTKKSINELKLEKN